MTDTIALLIVDDHPVVRDGLVAILGTQPDFKVAGEAASGEAALALYERLRPDVILLDLNLPRKDGREVLAEIKEDEDLRRIPVVILTVSGAEEDIIKTYNLHANCYIRKPVDLDQFIEVVKSIDYFWLTIVTLPTN